MLPVGWNDLGNEVILATLKPVPGTHVNIKMFKFESKDTTEDARARCLPHEVVIFPSFYINPRELRAL